MEKEDYVQSIQEMEFLEICLKSGYWVLECSSQNADLNPIETGGLCWQQNIPSQDDSKFSFTDSVKRSG